MNIIYILEVLKKYTDADHTANYQNIIDWIFNDYDVTLERKAIQRNITTLREEGYPIQYAQEIKRKSTNSRTGFYYDYEDEDVISDGELRLLMDSVLSSGQITPTHATHLIEKLGQMGSVSLRRAYSQVSKTSSQLPGGQADLFLNIELISKSIEENKKISFNCTDIGPDGKQYLKQEGMIASPYHLVMDRGHYYVICCTTGERNITHFRLDRMKNIHVLDDQPTDPLPRALLHADWGEYLRTHTYMFEGETDKVTMQVNHDCMSNLYDFFGEQITIESTNDKSSTVSVKANLNGLYYWALQQVDSVEVIKPQELRDALRESAKSMRRKYSKEESDRYNELMSFCERRENAGRPTHNLDLHHIDLSKRTKHRKLSGLCRITVGYNNITDYSFLKKYPHLEKLDITELAVAENFSYDLPTVTSLSIGPRFMLPKSKTASLQSLDILEHFQNLKELNLRHISVEDISAVYSLPNLEKLMVLLSDLPKYDLNCFVNGTPTVQVTELERLEGFAVLEWSHDE